MKIFHCAACLAGSLLVWCVASAHRASLQFTGFPYLAVA